MENQLVEVNNTSAFSDDKLNRKFLAENLKRILLNTDYNVFSINAPWGGGKSYFIENLAALIGDEAICISYNAWESDFYNNPLVPLVTELMYKLEQVIPEKDKIFKALKNTIKDIFDKITFNASIGPFGFTYDPNKPTVKSDYIALKKLKKKLRSGLGFLQEKLNKNIIIFVDDLDRCNPKYAIETLETIKHFFGIKNIIFVLAVDKKQVENIVKTIYGIAPETSDIEGYLKKFIDVEFNLPAPIYTDFISFHLQQIVECSKPFIETQRWYCYGEIINGRYIDNIEYKGLIANTVEQLVSSLNLTPRMIEKLFMRVKLTIESLGEDDLLLPEVIFILNVLYICDKKAFDSYVKTEAYNANLGDLGIKINKVYPYWTSVLNNFNEIYKTCHKKDKISLGTNESNILNLVNLIQQSAYRSHIYPFEQDIVKYLKSYASKIEFIGSMD
ncbi:TPA: hypothetical protein CPT85_02965 [Candidatus Gastranaerophilales bacterium HUM_21]|nr:MAG TPA: hypothetical protein CPT85_02965 [Candidatus Gastranaerophilales bacterium HUM_21]